jgi:hypothetical protein
LVIIFWIQNTTIVRHFYCTALSFYQVCCTIRAWNWDILNRAFFLLYCKLPIVI